MFERQRHYDSAELRAAGFRKLGLECEIAVRLKADFAPNQDPASAVGGVMCSVEIVEERFADFSRCARESLIADDFFGMGCVLGSEVTLADLGDLSELTGGFVVNGKAGPAGQRSSAILWMHWLGWPGCAPLRED
jgi:2-keto-4-pentenoate hydratase